MAGMGRAGLLVGAILQQLAGEAPSPPPPAAEPSRAAEEEISFDDFLNSLLNGVVAAARPGSPPALRSQLLTVTQALAQDANLPPALQALGQALQAILNGQPPDLAALPPELAAAVRQVLDQIPPA